MAVCSIIKTKYSKKPLYICSQELYRNALETINESGNIAEILKGEIEEGVKVILMPIYREDADHWFLVCIHMKEQFMEVFDTVKSLREKTKTALNGTDTSVNNPWYKVAKAIMEAFNCKRFPHRFAY